MRLFYRALLIGSLLMPTLAQASAPELIGGENVGTRGVKMQNARVMQSPMRVTAGELLADPEGTVLSGRFDEETCRMSGFQCSDQGRPGMGMKYMQAYHGCTKSINAVRVIGLFNYFDREEFEWLGCTDRPGINENTEMTKPLRFEVSFYRMGEDGMPGECVYKKEFDLIGRFTGVEYGIPDPYPLFEFMVELGEEVKLETGYMSFSAVNMGDNPSCWFAVFTADSSMDWGVHDMGDGEYQYASNPSVFSLLGTGEYAAKKALKLGSLASPLSSSIGTHEAVKVSLQNVGSENYSGTKLQLWVDGKLISTEEPGFTLAPGETRDYTFACRVDCSAEGEHTVRVINVTDGDEKISIMSSSVNTVRPAKGEYCESAAYYDGELGITSVKIGTIANESEVSKYSDFTALSTDILPGDTLVLDVEPKNQDIIGVWIDWNNDGLFTGQGEMAGYIYDKNLEISIPADVYVAPGEKRMRIIIDSFDNPSPCGEYYFGETEDYTINVKRPEDSPSISASMNEIEAVVNSNDKTISLDISNLGVNDLSGDVSAEYTLSPIYENRTVTANTEQEKAPARLKAKKLAPKNAPDANSETIHTLRYDSGMETAIGISNYDKAIFAQMWPEEFMASLEVEKARVFDPFGHAGFDPSGIIRLTP